RGGALAPPRPPGGGTTPPRNNYRRDQRPTTTTEQPTTAEIDAAARILMRAWAPDTLLPGNHDGEDPDEYCGCAGEDEDGDPLGCNCGGGCVCDECSYQAYAQYRRCWVQGCGRATAYRVVRFAMVEQHVSEPTASGAVCPHAEGEDHYCTPDTVYIDAGPKEQAFGHVPACGLAHAVQLRDFHRRHDTSRTQHRIEAWTYTPHPRDLPAPLPQLHEHTRSAHNVLGLAVGAHTRADHRGTQTWMDTARRYVALAAWNARRPLEHPHDGDQDDRDDEGPGPFQDEPGEPDEPYDAPETEAAAEGGGR
ncbi:hypothetical protein ACFXAZ_38490, partial [Streptomyces sp. NPDC059477]|uniref:hypothetical protein n=1 Tax=Streptomyces sp. NPDC059477 TaxID=3346847 RepID=UPI003678BDC1